MKSLSDQIDTLEEDGTTGPVTSQTIRAKVDDSHPSLNHTPMSVEYE
jgi:hypothetical protein